MWFTAFCHCTAELDLITISTDDIGMELGNDKCAYIYIERGKKTTLGEKFSINDIEHNELEYGEKYKYLDQDENIGYDNIPNKNRVLKEYFRRVRKIWSSELFSNNKTIAHNIFSIPIITPTIGIFNWTKDELEQIDIKTRKILTSSGSFHINSDIDRLYTPRNKGARGLNCLVAIYISRTVSINHHLKEIAAANPYIDLVLNYEKEGLMRVAILLEVTLGITTSEGKSPKQLLKTESKKTCHSLEKETTTWIPVSNKAICYSSERRFNQCMDEKVFILISCGRLFVCNPRRRNINCITESEEIEE